MSKMISIASGFQYSVNIGYDLNNEEKIQNFIPTASAIRLLEDILISTFPSSTERARVLIGAYGKGNQYEGSILRTYGCGSPRCGKDSVPCRL